MNYTSAFQSPATSGVEEWFALRHPNGADEQFKRCWRIQECKGCLDQTGCSWCPFTWTCVSNTHKIPALAPAYDEEICPHWAERWEIRTRPLGCQVSTITSLTTLVTIASTIACFLLIFFLVWTVKKLRALHKRHPGWWRSSKAKLAGWRERVVRIGRKNGTGDRKTVQGQGEREPLLTSDTSGTV